MNIQSLVVKVEIEENHLAVHELGRELEHALRHFVT